MQITSRTSIDSQLREHTDDRAGRHHHQTQVRTDGINLSDAAAAKVKSLLEQEGRDDLQLRIAVQPGGCSGLRYQLFFDERTLDGDVVTDFDGVAVVVDRMSVPYLNGADDRLRRHHREAGLHDRQPERHRLLRLRRLVPLSRPAAVRRVTGSAVTRPPAREVGSPAAEATPPRRVRAPRAAPRPPACPGWRHVPQHPVPDGPASVSATASISLLLGAGPAGGCAGLRVSATVTAVQDSWTSGRSLTP